MNLTVNTLIINVALICGHHFYNMKPGTKKGNKKATPSPKPPAKKKSKVGSSVVSSETQELKDLAVPVRHRGC